MINIRREGGLMKNGFNFYPLSDNNFGFVFRYGPKIPLTELGSKAFQVRYNKNIKKWYFGNFHHQTYNNE